MTEMAAWMLVALLGYGLFAGLIYFSQDRLLYPGSTYDRAQLVQFAAELKLEVWPTEDAYFGLVAMPRNSSAKGTVVVFHGNGGSAIDRQFYAEALVPLGYRVVLAEYPGYGARSGSVGEAPLVADAKEILHRARAQFGGPTYVLGESLGAGVAAAAIAAARGEVDGVLLITPWDSLPGVAADAYPYLPARRLVRDRYNTVEHLRAYSGPLGIVTAANDRVIRSARSAALLETVPHAKRWLIEGADHNNWTLMVDAAFWKEVAGQVFNVN